MKSKPFKDTSIFQGVIEFEDDAAQEYRAEKNGKGIYSIYLKKGDAFIYHDTTVIKGKATPKKIYIAVNHPELHFL